MHASAAGPGQGTGRTTLPGLRRLLPASFHQLRYSEQRRWMLLLAVTATTLILDCIGMSIATLTGALIMSVGVLGVVGVVGYTATLVLPARLGSIVLPSHLFLATLTVQLVGITVATERPWLFASVLGTLVPILAVQIHTRRAALVWTLVVGALLSLIVALALTGAWFNHPQPYLGSEALDHAFLALGLPIPLIVLVWFHEESRSHIETASSFKNAVLASMSHELRSPLNGVLGMLEDALGDELTPAQRERLAMAHRAGQSLLEIVDDALDLMQAESGGLVLSHEPFDLRLGLQALVDRRAAESSKPHVTLSLDYPDPLPQWFLGDGAQVLRVVDKLVDNGLKFTDEGYVRIRVEVETPSAEAEATLTIHVEDTGIGIPTEKHAVIFDKLTQLEDSWDRTRGGTGLGLAVCRELVSEMAGQIGVRDREGPGAELWFSIPLATAPRPSTAPTPAPTPQAAPDQPQQPVRALVVEDSVVNQMVAQRLLERLGCDVDVVADGRQAVARVRQAHYDIIFMDIQMPVMDGFQATAAIREASDEEVASLPVVAMTAFTMAGDRERCLEAGMDGYIGKPIDQKRLQSELLRWTHRGPSPTPSPSPT